MSTFHGACVGPVGAKLQHGDCPHTWANWHGTKVHTCECSCQRLARDRHSGVMIVSILAIGAWLLLPIVTALVTDRLEHHSDAQKRPSERLSALD